MLNKKTLNNDNEKNPWDATLCNIHCFCVQLLMPSRGLGDSLMLSRYLFCLMKKTQYVVLEACFPDFTKLFPVYNFHVIFKMEQH